MFQFQTFSLAGLFAGFTEAVLVNPFEVVKVTQQSNKAKMNETPSAWKTTADIIKREVNMKFILIARQKLRRRPEPESKINLRQARATQ